MKSRLTQKVEKKKHKHERKIEKLKRKEEKLKRRYEVINDSPLKREKLELVGDDNTVRYDFYRVLMGARFITDLTIPDHTPLQPETKFTKSWIMKNDGDGPWSECTKVSSMCFVIFLSSAL